jgi:hypothetical protein
MELDKGQVGELKMIVEAALTKVYTNDFSIVERAVNERSVVFRFGLYFSEMLNAISFKDFDLDCEYNRNMGDVKRTENFPQGAIPDILLHRRHSNSSNILVLEFKGYWNLGGRERDIQKIRDFTNQKLEYKYGLGALVNIGKEWHNVDYTLDYEPR